LIELVLATSNKDKIREIKEILGRERFRILSLQDFPGIPPVIEDGETLEKNALKKAKACADLTGMVCLADDTGLEVQVLEGRPGVRSSRYAGPRATYADNVTKLLREMRGVDESRRGAQFRCVVVIVDGEGGIHKGEGTLEGGITVSPRGENGFGYDPVFLVPSLGKTLAELSAEEKNQISHRANAVRNAVRSWIGA